MTPDEMAREIVTHEVMLQLDYDDLTALLDRITTALLTFLKTGEEEMRERAATYHDALAEKFSGEWPAGSTQLVLEHRAHAKSIRSLPLSGLGSGEESKIP